MTGLMYIYALLIISITASIHGHYYSGIRPGLKIQITRPGINYAAKVAVDVLTQGFKGRPIPDESGEEKGVSYSITGMRVTDFRSPSSKVTIQPGIGATFSLQGCKASVHGDWHYKYKKGWVKVSDHGSFDVSASGLGISVSVVIGMDKGRPTIKAYSCNSHLDSLSIHLHGGASWFYSLFKKLLIKPLEKKLKDLMCSAALKAINESGTKQLKKLKLKVTLRKVAELDYSLIENPRFDKDYMESYHKGEVFYKGDYTEAPFQPGPMTSGAESNRMVTIWASDYILNTMGLILHKHKLISYKLTKDDLDPKSKYKLNTTCPNQTCMGTLLSKVAKKYPDSSFELSMGTIKPPTANFLTNMTSGTFIGDVIYYIRHPNGTVTHLCSTNVTCTVNVTGWVDGNKLKGKVSGFNPEVSESVQCADGMSAPAMTFLFKMAGNMFIIPKLDELGQEGLEIPNMDDVAFKNPNLQLLKGYLRLSTDIHYSAITSNEIPDSFLYYRSNAS